MSLSMYQASVPVFIRALENFSAILGKASAWAAERKIDPAVLVNARLAPDMFALARQVQIASDTVKGGAARLAGVAVPSFADTELTFEDLQARLGKTIDFLKTIKAADVDGSEDRDIAFKAGPQEMRFKGQGYLATFVLPNLYFHMTTAYAILRHNGMTVGKMDYLGAF
jgi:hypothetical protein